MTPAPTVRVGRWTRRVTWLVSAVLFVASFEPHLENLPVLESVLTLFIPELTVMAVVAAIVVAFRAGVFNLISRHRATFAILGATFLFSTLSIIGYFPGPERQPSMGAMPTSSGLEFVDGRADGDGQTRSTDAQPSYYETWRATREHLYTLSQGQFTRRHMLLRAIRAFDEHRFEDAASYLRVSKEFLSNDTANAAADNALNFLASRERYVNNHRARIDKAAADFALSPVRLYLLRAVSQLERDDQREVALVALKSRIRAGGREALAAVDSCVLANRPPSATNDGRAMINLVIDAMGGLPTWNAPLSGADWCGRLKVPLAAPGSLPAFHQSFRTLTRSFWGTALDDPAAERESGPPPTRPFLPSTETDPSELDSEA